jgi:tetratricopeptide (TPR) repeat protein
LLIAISIASAPAARAGEFAPDGMAGLERLLGARNPSPEAVREEVARIGLWSGEPIGALDCARCHADAAAQWAASAHRYSSFNNPYYAVAVDEFRRERGARASRFCGDCHDPLLTVDGTMEREGRALDPATPAAQAGIVCLVCHSIHEPPDARGNGGFRATLDAIPRGTGEHAARLRAPTLGTARLCGGCHKVGLTEEVTGFHWQRGQDDYDAWNDSAISGHGPGAPRRPDAARRCQDCHMPFEPAVLGDLAAHASPGGGGEAVIRSHRFLGANSALAHLRGDGEHERRTAGFLRGAVTLDVQAGARGEADIVVRNRRVGHRFPGGTSDSNEVWLEVTALDGAGRVLAESGAPDGRGLVGEEAHRFRAQPVDAEGRPVARRDVQHIRGVAFDTSLSPADPQCVRYRLPAGTARVRARLRYRKFEPPYLERACARLPDAQARARCLAAPIVEVAEAEAAVRDGRVESDGGDPYERQLDHGLALADALADRASLALGPLRLAASLRPDRPAPQLGLARVALTLGQTDEAIAILDRLDGRTAGPPLDASLWLRAQALHHAYRDGPALVAVEALAARMDGDRNVLGLLARLRGLAGDARGALDAAERALAVDPEHEEALFQRMLAERELGRDDDAATEAWLRHRRDVEEDLALRRRYGRLRPALADEAIGAHVHRLEEKSQRAPAGK